MSTPVKKDDATELGRLRRTRDRADPGVLVSRAHRAEKRSRRPGDGEMSGARMGAGVDASAGGMRTALGVAYVVAFLLAVSLPFLAFGPTGLLILVPTVLWLAPGLRARVHGTGKLTDGVVGSPGLTALVCGAFSLALMAAGGGAMAAAWLASLAACGAVEVARARVAKGDNLRAESTWRGPRAW